MQEWYLLYTKPHKEPLVHRQLEDKGLATYFPYLQVARGYGRGIRIEPFFPCYLFVHMDLLSSDAYGLTWLPGVRHLVSFEGLPAQVPDSVLDTLQNRLAPYRDRVLAHTELLFKPDEPVRVVKGPLAGLEGIFQHGINGAQRVQILLNVLGQWTRVQLGARDIIAIAPHRTSLPEPAHR